MDKTAYEERLGDTGRGAQIKSFYCVDLGKTGDRQPISATAVHSSISVVLMWLRGREGAQASKQRQRAALKSSWTDIGPQVQAVHSLPNALKYILANRLLPRASTLIDGM